MTAPWGDAGAGDAPAIGWPRLYGRQFETTGLMWTRTFSSTKWSFGLT